MEPLELVRCARGAKNRSARSVGHLDCGRANSGRGRMNENSLAQVKAGPGEESVVRGDENFRHRARLHPIKLGRNTGKITPGHNDKLCLCATGSDSENAIANFPSANRVTNRFDFACVELNPRRRRPTVSPSLRVVRAVIPKTRSPTFQVRTASPIDSTSPANSKPGMFVG